MAFLRTSSVTLLYELKPRLWYNWTVTSYFLQRGQVCVGNWVVLTASKRGSPYWPQNSCTLRATARLPFILLHLLLTLSPRLLFQVQHFVFCIFFFCSVKKWQKVQTTMNCEASQSLWNTSSPLDNPPQQLFIIRLSFSPEKKCPIPCLSDTKFNWKKVLWFICRLWWWWWAYWIHPAAGPGRVVKVTKMEHEKKNYGGILEDEDVSLHSHKQCWVSCHEGASTVTVISCIRRNRRPIWCYWFRGFRKGAFRLYFQVLRDVNLSLRLGRLTLSSMKHVAQAVDIQGLFHGRYWWRILCLLYFFFNHLWQGLEPHFQESLQSNWFSSQELLD